MPKVHSTNYTDTFIAVAKDTKAIAGVVPPVRKTPTVSQLTFERLSAHPYRYTSDEVIFEVYAERKAIPKKDRKAARAAFFSKGQPCLRCSDLAKKYGWGIHSDAGGRVALYGMESPEYATFASGCALDPGVRVDIRYAMRATR